MKREIEEISSDAIKNEEAELKKLIDEEMRLKEAATEQGAHSCNHK